MGLLAADFFVVEKSPLVVAYAGAADIRPDIERLRRCGDRPVVFEHLSWWAGTPEHMRAILERQRWLATRGIEHHVLVNTGEEDELRGRLRVRGALCSKNIYCDEHVFDLADPAFDQAADGDRDAHDRLFTGLGAQDRFDAVYIAALKPYKRLELAREIGKLLVVSYGGDLHRFCPELAHAKFNWRWMPPWAVAACIRHSHCGLALSAVEGQNNATVEYQLCGVPVVSTSSKGGRELFLDDEGSVVVAPHAAAVAEAVAGFRASSPDGAAIRERTLTRIGANRSALCRYASGILNERGCPVSDGALMNDLFGAPAERAGRYVRRREIETFIAPASFAGGIDASRDGS